MISKIISIRNKGVTPNIKQVNNKTLCSSGKWI